METLRQWIEECADGEPIEAVVIGEMGCWGSWGSEGVPNYENCPKGVVLTWESALPWLSYEFDSGYGAPKCQAVVAWTENRVIAISQYDGSTSPFWLPRDPIDRMPEMPGR